MTGKDFPTTYEAFDKEISNDGFAALTKVDPDIHQVGIQHFVFISIHQVALSSKPETAS